MSAPTPLPENYVGCQNSTFTIGTSPNTSVLNVIQGGYMKSYAVDEMTNSGSAACYEDVKTIRSAKGSFTAAWVAASPPPFQDGDIFPIVIDNPNGPYLACNARFNNVNPPVLNVKDGLKYSFDITSQGAITTTRPS